MLSLVETWWPPDLGSGHETVEWPVNVRLLQIIIMIVLTNKKCNKEMLLNVSRFNKSIISVDRHMGPYIYINTLILILFQLFLSLSRHSLRFTLKIYYNYSRYEARLNISKCPRVVNMQYKFISVYLRPWRAAQPIEWYLLLVWIHEWMIRRIISRLNYSSLWQPIFVYFFLLT